MDIAKCFQACCPIREHCLRFLAVEGPYQSWICPSPIGMACRDHLPKEQPTMANAELFAHEMPTEEAITVFYRQWFEDNYCIPPSAKACSTAVLAIQAAFAHFAPPTTSETCSL